MPLVGAYFGGPVEGGYVTRPAGIRMRNGTSRTVRVLVHQDPKGELLRGAICDDELVQAIGRGRGINRGPANPLAVHILADVALPLVHDRIVPWDAVKPDLFQRMLLAGVAVSSPGDARQLHPSLLPEVAAAEKAFQRAFGGQFPIGDTYRGMSVKSARYRRVGRGRAWQRAWWIEGEARDARRALETALGTLAEWKPSD